MKQGLFILTLLIVISLLAACNGGVAQPETARAQPAVLVFETQSNNEQSVTVEITPLNLSQGGSSVDFEVAFNTHSVELDFDPAKISVLRDDQGHEYPALAWEGSGPTGHHRSGTLRFNVFDHPSDFVEVVIRDVAQVPERVFRWDLTKQ